MAVDRTPFDPSGDIEMAPLIPVAYGMLKAHGWARAIVFWCADGEDGFRTTYGAYARPTGDGRATLTVRELGRGGLDLNTTTL